MRASLAFNYICEHIDEINIILFDDCISIRADIMRFYKLYPHRINACYLSQNPYEKCKKLRKISTCCGGSTNMFNIYCTKCIICDMMFLIS